MPAPRYERRWVLGFAVVVMLATTFPYLVGFQVAQANPEWRYSGLLFGTEDGYSYLAKMLLGSSGTWVFRTPYTAYETRGMLAFLPYMALGKLTAMPGQFEQLVALFHLFRILAGILLILAVYDFISNFVFDAGLRRLGLALSVLGGGFGWLAVLGLDQLWSGALPGMDIPLEFYSPETFGFLMIFGLPHLAAARAFMLWSLLAYLRPGRPGGSWREGVRPGLLCLAIGVMQPLTIIVEWAVLGVHVLGMAVWRWYSSRRSLTGQNASWAQWWSYTKKGALVVMISSPAVVYTFFAMRLDPVLAGWEGQNTIVSPPPHHYALAFGLLVPFALAGIRQALRRDFIKNWLLAGWIAAFPFLAYAPYNLQRRLPEGVWVAMVALAMIWIEPRGGAARRWAQRVLGLGFLTTLILYAGSLYSVTAPQNPLFRNAAEVEAFEFLAETAGPNDVVLAAYDTSNALPAWSTVRTLLGSGPESINLEDVQARVACFYQAECSMEDRDRLLQEFDIDYVFWGLPERRLGSWDLTTHPGLEPIYQHDGIVILKVDTKPVLK